MLLKEKDPGFIQDTRIEGNLSVVKHPANPTYYGDGSIEVGGILRSDGIMSATPQSVVHIGSPFNFQQRANRPSAPPLPGEVQVYSDPESDGRLVMVNAEGLVIDLNPLGKIGDIMTFDGIKNSTVRLPSGLPGQQLSYDPWLNFRSGLSWKSQTANAYGIIQPSDAYARYLELSSTSVQNVTTAPIFVTFDDVLRCDTDCFAPAQSDFIVLRDGIYEFGIKVTVGFDETNTSVDTVGCAEVYVEISDPTGFVVVPGSRAYTNFISHDKGKAFASISYKLVTSLTTSTRVRIVCKEYGTSHGLLSTIPSSTLLSVRTVAPQTNDQSEYFVTHGVVGARPVLPSEFSVLQLNNIVLKTNDSDTVTINSPRVSSAGKRLIHGKVSFESNNFPVDGKASIETVLTLNGTVFPHSSTFVHLYGNEISNSAPIGPYILDLAIDDVVGFSSRLVTSSSVEGSINIVSDECSVYLQKLDENLWDKMNSIANSSTPLNPSRFSILAFENTATTTGDEFTAGNDGKIFSVKSGGTVTLTYTETVQNNDADTYTAYFNLVTDTGDGFKEVPGSGTYATVLPGHSQTVMVSNTVYVKPHSLFRCQALAVHGGQLDVRDDSGKFLIEKIEKTISPFIGETRFGRFWKYVEDATELQTTNTIFAQRLAAITMNLPAGTYRLGLSFEWDMTEPGVGFETQLMLDEGTQLESFSTVPTITGSFQKVTTFKEVYLSSGEHVFSFQTRIAEETRALLTRNIRIELFAL